jgi:hypothetical protein
MGPRGFIGWGIIGYLSSCTAWLCWGAQVSFSPPAPVPVVLPNPGFENGLEGTWAAHGDGGEFERDSSVAHFGQASVRARDTRGRSGFFLNSGQLVTARAKDCFKLAAWVKTSEATGDTYLSLDGYQGGDFVATLARSRSLSGTTPDWVYCWVIATVPEGCGISHVRPALCSDNNRGTAWFDDVRLLRLPPDQPLITGPPADPPHGQITAANGHLVDQKRRRVRLWGVNCVDSPNRTYRELAYIPHRIRDMGFNAVRLHLYDSRIINTEAVNAHGEATTLVMRRPQGGDGSPLDKLDYFIYCCERAGLYLYLTFDRSGSRFGPGDYDVLPSDGPEDEQAWKEAVQELQPQCADEHAYYVDPRLGAAQARFVEGWLKHRNAYTGKRVADDPYVALYELTNENHFPEWMLTGGFRGWPEYFRSVLQKRWNQWLRLRYGTQEKLLEAWGKLAEGESLEAGTIQVAPILSEAAVYPPERLADFHRFVYDLFAGYSRRLEAIIRKAGHCSALVPVSWDTLHEHKHKWYYPCSLAGLMTVGTYVHGPAQPDPKAHLLNDDFRAIYNLSWASVYGKPTVIYETNTLKPDYWRATYPMLISAFASTHDWDGVFWYCWEDGTVPDEIDADTFWATGMRYAAPSHTWHGVVICTDEVLLASLRLAGALFCDFAIPPTPEPVLVTVGANDLLGPALWIGDISIPYPENAPGPWKRAYAQSMTDFLYTCRYRYDLRRRDSSVTRPLIGRLPQPCRPVPEVTYDWEQGTLMVDSAKVKAAVGFLSREVTFHDGVRFQLLGELDPRFLCFGLAASDGVPLTKSRRAVLVLTTYGENRGRILWEDPSKVPGDVPLFAKLVKAWGWGPAEIVRPAVRVALNGHWRWRLVNFSLETLSEGQGTVLEVAAGTPMFMAELWR